MGLNWTGNRNLGMLLLAIWLIGHGLMAFIRIDFVNFGLIWALLALAAGICILIGR